MNALDLCEIPSQLCPAIARVSFSLHSTAVHTSHCLHFCALYLFSIHPTGASRTTTSRKLPSSQSPETSRVQSQTPFLCPGLSQLLQLHTCFLGTAPDPRALHTMYFQYLPNYILSPDPSQNFTEECPTASLIETLGFCWAPQPLKQTYSSPCLPHLSK